jgi:hypothetical protein
MGSLADYIFEKFMSELLSAKDFFKLLGLATDYFFSSSTSSSDDDDTLSSESSYDISSSSLLLFSSDLLSE